MAAGGSATTGGVDVAIGPVEYVIIGFPGNQFKGEILPALADLVESGTVRILDLVFVIKDEEGNVTSAEYEDLPGMATSTARPTACSAKRTS